MSAIKALVAAASLAVIATPAASFAHGDWDDDDRASFGFFLGGAPTYYYAPDYYDSGYYGPAYTPVYYHRYYYSNYYYPHHYYYRTYRRHYYYRHAYYRYAPCRWFTNRYYERNGDYVVRHERVCR